MKFMLKAEEKEKTSLKQTAKELIKSIQNEDDDDEEEVKIVT